MAKSKLIKTQKELMQRFTVAEMDTLLKLNKAIASTKDKVELLRVINDEIKSIIPFDAPGLFIVNEKENYHYDITVVHPEINNDDANDALSISIEERIPHKGTAIEEVMTYDKAKLWHWKNDLIDKDFQHPYFPLMLQYQFFNAMACPLKVRGKIIGFFSVSSAEDIYTEKQLPFFTAVTDVLAIAIANILANEEIQTENRTKAILLNISEHIAGINKRKELFAVIINEIQSIIPIDDTGILVLNNEGSKWKDWTNIDNYQETEVAANLNRDGFNDYIEMTGLTKLAFTETGILTVDDYLNEDHPFAPYFVQYGFKEFLFTPLISHGKTIGSLFFDSKKYGTYSPAIFPTFRSIANMIASAVANIIANEEILEREREKDILLTISQKLSMATKADELLQIIINEVKPIFNFYDTGILVIDETLKGVYDLSVVYPHIDHSEVNDFLYNKGYYKDNNVLKLKNSVVEYILEQFEQKKVSYIFDYLQDYAAYSDGALLTDLKNGGYISAWMCPLVQQGKTFGVLSLNFKNNQSIPFEKETLFLALSDRIASSLANILANEEILEREREKTKLLEITALIAQVKDTQDLLKLIVQKIKPLFNFHDCGLFILSSDKNTHTDYAAILPDVSPSEWNELIASVSTKIEHKNSPAEWVINTIKEREKPVLFDFVELVNKFPKYPQFDGTGILEMGYRDCLAFNLIVRGEIIGMFCINALQKDFFKPGIFRVFQSTTESISIAVANILAAEELQTKADEIATLNKQLQAQNNYLIEEVEQVYNFDEMIGQNPKFSEVCKNIGLVANTDSTVLILGETGTGKELVARAIHNNSPRKGRPLIKLNCAALPANLIESELFGHERGAFTGAFEKRIGKFELANGSTLFLDEVGELPLELQAKLLRALQEKEIERLGSNKTIQLDVRIIAATNRELEKEVQVGKFRQDLYYRLHIFPITLPSLKERKEDIPLLAAHFLERYTKKVGKKIAGFSTKAMQDMMSYNWPGNIRELEHVIERCVILGRTKLIQDMNLPNVGKGKTTKSTNDFVVKTWEEQERDYILEILKITNGKVKGIGSASELLQLPATTLQSKMDKLGIKRQHFNTNKKG